MWHTLKTYGRELHDEWEKDNVSSLAAALAYYATFSLVPTVIILIAIGSIWAGEDAVREQVLVELHLWIGPSAAQIAREALEGNTQTSGALASGLSLVALLVGATQLFAELQAALNRVWEVKPRGLKFWDTVRRRALAVLLLFMTGLLLTASFITSSVLRLANDAIGGFGHWQVINVAAAFVLGTLLFSLMFKHFPAVKLQLRDVRLGAALTTALLILAKYLLSLYVARASIASTYGAAGTIIVFLLWVYVSAQIVLMGAEFTQVHCRLQGRIIELNDRAEARRI